MIRRFFIFAALMLRRLFVGAAAFLLSFAACALTGPQLATLKAAILANPTWNAFPNNGDGHLALAALLNSTAVPNYYVERTSLSRHEILTATSGDGTTFTWTGGAYITRSQGERDAFREMFNSTGSVNPSLATIKSAFSDIFSGAGGLTNRTHITALSRRKATSFEVLFATGLGTTASPSVMAVEGPVSPTDVDTARNLP